jgi:hypothetical protein
MDSQVTDIEDEVRIHGKLPGLGFSSFVSYFENDVLLVDKSLMIKEFLVSPDFPLILCPRRFGKSTNISMMATFFDIQYKENQGIIEKMGKFKIAEVDEGKWFKEHAFKYPVIFLSLKSK